MEHTPGLGCWSYTAYSTWNCASNLLNDRPANNPFPPPPPRQPWSIKARRYRIEDIPLWACWRFLVKFSSFQMRTPVRLAVNIAIRLSSVSILTNASCSMLSDLASGDPLNMDMIPDDGRLACIEETQKRQVVYHAFIFNGKPGTCISILSNLQHELHKQWCSLHFVLEPSNLKGFLTARYPILL